MQSMLADERRSRIMSILQKEGVIKVRDISKHFNVTVETARRDIAALQEQKLVNKVYGGAVLAGTNGTIIKDSLYSTRETQNKEEKCAIGKLAATMINEGDTIILGSGTTILEIAKNIKNIPNLTVITNALPIVMELVTSKINIFCTGGTVGDMDMNMTGAFSLNALTNFHVDVAFVTGLGITSSVGVTTFTLEEALFAKQIRTQSSKTILTMDSSKFGHNSLVVQGSVHDYDLIITDSNIGDSYIREFRNIDVPLKIAQIE